MYILGKEIPIRSSSFLSISKHLKTYLILYLFLDDNKVKGTKSDLSPLCYRLTLFILRTPIKIVRQFLKF